MRANKDDMLPIALASRVDIAQPTNAFVGMVSADPKIFLEVFPVTLRREH